MMMSFALLERVQIGSLEHVIPIVMAVLGCIWFIKYAIANLDIRQQQKKIHFFAIFVSLSVVVFHLYKIALGGYHIATDLPLYLCSLLALIIPVFTYYRKYWMFEILLFWVIAGTTQGVLTPDIAEGFPVFDYFRYWIVHLGLLIIIFYFIFVFKMKPNLKSVFKSFLALQVYFVVTICINYMLNANYSYLNRKPDAASVLDYLGDWPYYIIVIQLIIIPFFLLIYLPFYLSGRRKVT